jgi:hypothetical protein
VLPRLPVSGKMGKGENEDEQSRPPISSAFEKQLLSLSEQLSSLVMTGTLAHTAAITEACNTLRAIAAEYLESKQKVIIIISKTFRSLVYLLD